MTDTSNISTSMLGNTTFMGNQSKLDRTVYTNARREEIAEVRSTLFSESILQVLYTMCYILFVSFILQLKAEAPTILNGKLWQSVLESDRVSPLLNNFCIKF